MTLVVTHANGFLGCFTREPDGSMRQRALIDTGDDAPTPVALAELGARLQGEFGWNGSVAVAPAKTKRALPVAEAKPKARPYDTESDPMPTDERKAAIVAYVRDHPYSSKREVIAGIGMEPTAKRVARWHHAFAALCKAGELAIAKRRSGIGQEMEYCLPEGNA